MYLYPAGENPAIVTFHNLELLTNISKLKQRWKNESIPLAQTATKEALVLFSSNTGLFMPADLTGYFTELNGTSGEYDNRWFNFFSLSAFKTVKEELGNWGGTPDYRNIVTLLDGHEQCFVFAEHSIHLLTYAIRLYPHASDKNEVYVICGEKFAVIANSFTEFIQLYLLGGHKLYI